jgi:hypothetical protein
VKKSTKPIFRLMPVVLLVGCTGIFPNGEFQPTGTQFNLNSAVQVKSIVGSTSRFDTTAMFSVDMTGTSTSSGNESAVLPAGLFMKSKKSAIQHMIIVKDYPIAVPPGHDTLITIGVFCCNSTKDVPDNTDTFEIGPVTDNSELQQVVAITKTRHLGPSNSTFVQQVIWNVTDGKGLPQSTIDSLNALPPGPTGLAANSVIRVPPGFFKLQKQRARNRQK